MKRLLSLITVVVLSSSCGADKPNIVYIICDDLGYGDVHCLAPETSKIPTPNADALASEGMIFTDAHSGSSVCSPTRYGIMTGRYSWRTRLQKGVVTGFAPSLIACQSTHRGELSEITGLSHRRRSASGISISSISIRKPAKRIHKSITRHRRSAPRSPTVRSIAASITTTAFIMPETWKR